MAAAYDTIAAANGPEAMNRDTRRRLDELNDRFYRERAAAFGQTRDHPWPGWTRVLERLTSPAGGAPLRVLDVGCGNGRFGRFLAASAKAPVDYTGIDRSEPLLAEARDRLADAPLASVRLALLDAVARPGDLPRGPFELIVLFGVLHHIPGHAARDALLADLAARLTEGGLLALTIWRFGDAERFERRRIDWADYNASADEPIDADQLEDGDHLLGFGDGGPPRYCHHMSEAELVGLGAGFELERDDAYRADGKSGDLNQYLLLRRR